MHYHGQMALQVALLVAFTQLIPEHQVQIFGILKARVKVLDTLYAFQWTVHTIFRAFRFYISHSRLFSVSLDSNVHGF
jgi:hypothetical protein